MNGDPLAGLSTREAARRLREDGPNLISGEHTRRWRDIAAETLKFVRANQGRPFFLYYSVTLPASS